MNRKWLWLVIVAVAVGGFVAGVVVAQEEDWDWDYWYLPEYYSESYTPTLVEWKELAFNTYEDRKAWLTDRLQQTSCALWVTELGINVEVDTRTKSGWDMYLGDGDFACSDEEVRATYTEAAEEILDLVYDYFPELDEEDVWIEFFIEDVLVASWVYGEMLLEGEE